MPNYLIRISATAAYVDGLVREGFVAREAYVKQLIEGMGGSLRSCFWSHGEADGYLVVWAPDVEVVNAALLAANREGNLSTSTVSLFTSAEMDQATRRLPEYRAAGATAASKRTAAKRTATKRAAKKSSARKSR